MILIEDPGSTIHRCTVNSLIFTSIMNGEAKLALCTFRGGRSAGSKINMSHRTSGIKIERAMRNDSRCLGQLLSTSMRDMPEDIVYNSSIIE